MTVKKLPYEKKQSWQMFDGIASTYDRINAILSLGIVSLWRRVLVRHVPQQSQLHCLDCATGTGEVMGSVLKSRANDIAQYTGIDLSREMMAQGEQSKWTKQFAQKVSFQHASALELPFKDSSFDCVTMAFGIRNVGDYKACLCEIFRVLKPGGRALIMEFALPSFFVLRWIYLAYFRWVLPFVAGVLSGNIKAYRYLNQTVEQFPYGSEFTAAMLDAGFEKEVRYHNLTGGIAMLYVGHKPLL